MDEQRRKSLQGIMEAELKAEQDRQAVEQQTTELENTKKKWWPRYSK
jgi:hypothetical protein